MTRDDIIRMAVEAELFFDPPHCTLPPLDHHVDAVARFAALVAAAEREECAKVVDKMNTFGVPPDIAAAIRARGQA